VFESPGPEVQSGDGGSEGKGDAVISQRREYRTVGRNGAPLRERPALLLLPSTGDSGGGLGGGEPLVKEPRTRG
jgi:hypothetical protein